MNEIQKRINTKHYWFAINYLHSFVQDFKLFLPLSVYLQLMIFNTFIGVIGPNQILLIALVLVLLFGARKIPELMKGIGQGIKEFKNAKEGADDQKDKDKLEQKN